MTLVYISLFFIFLPLLVMLVILANRVLADLREQKRELDPATRDFLRLCWVTLLVAQALKGW